MSGGPAPRWAVFLKNLIMGAASLGAALLVSWTVMWGRQEGYDALPVGSRRWVATRAAHGLLVGALWRFYWLAYVADVPFLGHKSATEDKKDSPSDGERDKKDEEKA